MRPPTIVLTGIAIAAIIAFSECRAIADAPLNPTIDVAPDQPTIHSNARRAVITVTGTGFPARGTRVSIIAYAPDGTMVKRPRRRLLRNGMSKLMLQLGENAQAGTYTVHATVESKSQAFGMPTRFAVVPE